MNHFHLFCIVMLSLPAMSLISIVWKAIAAAIRESEVRREKEAQEQAAIEKRRTAAAKRQEKKRKAEERAAAILAKEQKRQRKQAEKIEAARQLAELIERALQAEKDLKAMQAGKPLPERAETISPESTPAPAAPAQPAALPIKGNNAFVGQVVAFTGTLDGMTRAEAIKAVEANGGKAFADMTAATTILVVGDKPGKNKLDKADRWIGQVRKITKDDFMVRLHAPLTVTLQEFEQVFAGGTL